MNERIKELAEQATKIEHGVDNGFDMVIFDKEKFAELIVRKCAIVADKAEPYKSKDLILKHFGVEE